MADRFVARKSPVGLLLMLAGAVAFVICGLYLTGLFGPPADTYRIVVGWFTIAFFGLAGYRIVTRFLGPNEQIVIDGNGIFNRPHSEATIPWDTIQGYDVRTGETLRFACLSLKDPARFPRTGTAKWLGALNKSGGYDDVLLSTVGTDRSFDELWAALGRFAPPSLVSKDRGGAK